MSEMQKPQKLRLYKFAAEYNLSSDMIEEFLKGKGYQINSQNTPLTKEMLEDLNVKFKKEIEKAEDHYRKVSEFNKMRQDAPLPEEVTETEVAAKSSEIKAEETVVAEVQAESVEEPDEIGAEAGLKEEIEEEPADDEADSEIVQSVENESEIESVKQSSEDQGFKTRGEIELDKKKKGLTIVGRINLMSDKEAVKQAAQERPAEEKAPVVHSDRPHNENQEDEPAKKKKLKIKKKKKKEPGEVTEEPSTKNKKKKKLKRPEVDKQVVDAAVKRTMLGLDESVVQDRAKIRKMKRKEKQEIQDQIDEIRNLEEQTKVKVTEFISVIELSNLMGVSVNEVIQKFMSMGLMVSINQRLDKEAITLVADDFGFEVEFQDEFAEELLEEKEDENAEFVPRSPVVTIMGHVDHGKTSLLDYIRKANVVAGESGGITQHIGAYKVKVKEDKYITFLDTPGHEAFTAMRARGASVTDIVVLIVAADDAVMPQTVEAINHAMAAGVPMIIAINKIDKPGANIEKIKQQLAERNILVEDWGGKYQCAQISAKAGLNIDVLLEKIILEAELLDLKAPERRHARGIVIESQIDKGRGVTATILVQKGTLRAGDPFVAGVCSGRVRAMFDERNKKIAEAGPSTPVLVLGFESAPQAGDTFICMESEREVREVSIKRQQLKREQDHRQVRLITLDEIASQVGSGAIKELPIIVKGDVDGSVEALADSLMKLSNEEVKVKVIHKAVGAISEGDVLLAAASNAIIIGFHVRPNVNARRLSESEKIDIRLYNVIYDAINEVKSALEGMLSPVLSEVNKSTVEVRDIFKVPKVGTVAGCYVQDGKIARSQKIRLFRNGVVVYEGSLSSLKRFKDDVKEVDAGYECGLSISNFNDIKIGDIVESYQIVETKKKFED